MTGFTDSTNFPTTANAFQAWTNLNHSTNAVLAFNGLAVPFDAFVAQFDTTLSAAASLSYSTLLGGTNNDAGYRIRMGPGNNVYVTGNSSSGDFPNINNVAAFPTNLTSGIYSTNIANYDAILTKINFGVNPPAIVYSALFGGTNTESGWDVAVDPAGEAFVIGNTTSSNFPTANTFGLIRAYNSGSNDVFVTAFNANASALLYSAYLGGTNDDFGYGIAVDPAGNAYIVGQTASANFPTTNALRTTLTSTNDAFLAKILMTPPPQPTLALALAGPNALVSWPMLPFEPELTNFFKLEFNTNVASTNPWTLVPQAPVVVNGFYTVTNAATSDALFFRLHAQ